MEGTYCAICARSIVTGYWDLVGRGVLIGEQGQLGGLFAYIIIALATIFVIVIFLISGDRFWGR